jgi:CO/xanthine dehydrogenase Mo-binding subunit
LCAKGAGFQDVDPAAHPAITRAADVLGRPYQEIEVIIGDTELVPDHGGERL